MNGYSAKDKNEVSNVIGGLAFAAVLATVASPIALLAGGLAIAGIGKSIWENDNGSGKTNKYDVEMQKLKIQETKERIAMNREIHNQKMAQLQAGGSQSATKQEANASKSAGLAHGVQQSDTSIGRQAMNYVRMTSGKTLTSGPVDPLSKAQSDYAAYKESLKQGVADQLKADQKNDANKSNGMKDVAKNNNSDSKQNVNSSTRSNSKTAGNESRSAGGESRNQNSGPSRSGSVEAGQNKSAGARSGSSANNQAKSAETRSNSAANSQNTGTNNTVSKPGTTSRGQAAAAEFKAEVNKAQKTTVAGLANKIGESAAGKPARTTAVTAKEAVSTAASAASGKLSAAKDASAKAGAGVKSAAQKTVRAVTETAKTVVTKAATLGRG